MGRLRNLQKRWRRRRPDYVSGILSFAVSMIGRTLRVDARGFEADPSKVVYCGWHGRTFPFATHFRDRGWWVIVSRSRDGDIQNAVFESLGFHTTRGSTGRGRGGVRAAVRAIRTLRDGGVLAMTPDGPRGPSERVQEGVLVIAQRSGARLVPVGAAVSRAWTIRKSWDGYVIPKPFARVLMIAGDPICVPSGASPEEFEAARLRLEEGMTAMQSQVSRELRR